MSSQALSSLLQDQVHGPTTAPVTISVRKKLNFFIFLRFTVQYADNIILVQLSFLLGPTLLRVEGSRLYLL